MIFMASTVTATGSLASKHSPQRRRPELQYLEFPFGADPRKTSTDIASHKAGEGGVLL